MRPDFTSVRAVAVPPHSAIAQAYATTHFADAYAVPLPPEVNLGPEQLARCIMLNQPPWVAALMKLRDGLVARLGLKTASDLTASGASGAVQRVGIFRIYSANATEIVLGEDDKHLNFRLSVLCSEHGIEQPQPQLEPQPRLVTVSTVAYCHNAFGRAYIFAIASFHRAIVQASLRRAARSGWSSR